uniref:Superoxide dismutase copper/zinc binding domain-containing protein n=2 Tax=Tetranychus urticae TaxID=32264 RepID=T1KD37_TETUR
MAIHIQRHQVRTNYIVNRFDYRYGNGPNYGSKYGYPSQFMDSNKPPFSSPDSMIDANNYWRHFRERYPPAPPQPYQPLSSLNSAPGLSPYSSSILPYHPTQPLSASASSLQSGLTQLSPPSAQSSLNGSPVSSQPPLSTFDAKYGLIPGQVNFPDNSVTFDHRFGWVPRYPNYALSSGNNYYMSQGQPHSYSNPKVTRGTAEIKGSDNKITGSISFEQEENEHVTIRGKILGLSPGAHGMHILEKPLTGNDCSSGGDHYNPQKTEHGGKYDWIRHVGDLGNIFADRDGIAYFDLTDQIISLSGGYSVLNRTIVVTEKADDLGRSGDLESKRTGNSGPAIACGLIQLAKF